MALNSKEPPFGFNVEERLSRVNTKKPTQEYTHTNTHNDVYEPEKKTNKTKRIQILTYEHLIDRMDAYAEKRGVKRVAVFEAAITAYLDQVDPET